VLAAAMGVLLSAGPAAGRGTQFVSRPEAGQPREGQPVVLHGHAHGAPHGALILLQGKGLGGWRTLGRVPLHGLSFTITWHPRAGGQEQEIRFALAGPRGRVLAAGGARQVLVGQAPVLCLAPPLPAIPPGEGAIVGGVYINGGPAPGVRACSEAAGTVVEALNAAGAVVGSQTVSQKRSYAFQLPPGSYTLRTGGANYCSGQAVVTAGKITHADTECQVP